MEINYEEYLLTPHWQELSDEIKRLAGYRCSLCNCGGVLHVHHRTYERLGHEWQSDLICLCEKCHAKFHDILDPNESEKRKKRIRSRLVVTYITTTPRSEFGEMLYKKLASLFGDGFAIDERDRSRDEEFYEAFL